MLTLDHPLLCFFFTCPHVYLRVQHAKSLGFLLPVILIFLSLNLETNFSELQTCMIRLEMQAIILQR